MVVLQDRDEILQIHLSLMNNNGDVLHYIMLKKIVVKYPYANEK